MAEQSILPPTWDVPEEFKNRLGRQAGRQRPMLSEGHLLLVLHRPPRPDEVKRSGRYFWRKPDGTWTSSDLGAGPRALGRHLDEYAEVLERYDRQEEEAVDAEDYFAVLEALAPVHRAARHLYQALQEARQMVPQDRDLINFRDRAYETERAAELLYQETRNSLDFLMAHRAEEQAASSRRMAVSAHRLNLLAAFFFPIATLSAVLGVNLKHGWEQVSAPWPFLAMLAVGLTLGLILRSFVTQEPHRPERGVAPEDTTQPGGPKVPYRKDQAPSDPDRRVARR